MAPNAAAQEAFIKIKAITPAFTAFPIFFGEGNRMALIKAEKIIHENGSRNIMAHHSIFLWVDKKRMPPITIQ